MKKIIALLLLSLCLGFSWNVQAGSSQKDVNVLFIQNAKAGAFIPMSQPGHYQLKLSGVDNTIHFFTDRPARRAGIYPTDKFLARWQAGRHAQSFNKVPPNAALSASIGRGFREKEVRISIELSDPHFDANSQTLVYNVRILPGQDNQAPKGRLRNIVLFIDDYCASCTGGHW